MEVATLYEEVSLETVGQRFAPASLDGASGSVKIDASAFGEVRGRSFVALACSNHFIVLRLMTRSLRPALKLVPWFTSSSKRIVALTFDRSCQWLLASTAGGSVYLVPALDLVGAREAAPPSTPIASPQLASFTVAALLKPQGMPNLVAVATLRPRQGTVHCCLWWKSNGRDLALLGVDSGDIVVIDLRRREEVEVISVCNAPIVAMSIVSVRATAAGIDFHVLARPDPARATAAERSCQWLCPVERTARNGIVTNVVGRATERDFQATKLVGVEGCNVSLRKVEGRQLLGVYRPFSTEGGRFDLYDLATPRLSGGERRLSAPTRTLHLPWGKSGAHAAEVHAILVDEKYRNSLFLTRGLGARAR